MTVRTLFARWTPGAGVRTRPISRLRAGAERGDPATAFDLGSAYLHGRGVIANGPSAARWLTVAAEGGHAEAQYELGRLLAGRAPEAPGFALRWFEAASSANETCAAANRALLFPDGMTLAPDLEAAFRKRSSASSGPTGSAASGHTTTRGPGTNGPPSPASPGPISVSAP